jgi:predicted homoserine dehydrogenase-like protein
LENHKTARKENLIPQGLTDGAVLKRDIKMDEPVAFDDVDLPENRLADQLWAEQKREFKI